MAVDTLIAQLQANRRMRSRAEVEAFDQALAQLANAPDYEVIEHLQDLLMAFDDACEHIDVMWGLIHCVEYYGMEVELQALTHVLPRLLSQAPEWVKILHYRILNDPASRTYYKTLLPSLPLPQQQTVRRLLEQIAQERGHLRAAAEYILNQE